MERPMRERIHWVDVAKGLLILLVVYGHLDWIAATKCGTEAFNYKGQTNFMFLPYYMPAFFILTGLCSNFAQPTISFLKKNFLLLIIPNMLIGVFLYRWIDLFLNENLSVHNFMEVDYVHILLTTGGWFLPALFISKCMVYGLLRIRNAKYAPLIATIVIMYLGMSLYNRGIVNPWYYQHAFMASPFLLLGYYLKRNIDILDSWWIPVMGGAFLIMAYFVDYPYLNANPHINWRNSLLYLAMSGFGSFTLFWLSVKISSCRVLECIGRHTLVIYLLHGVFLCKLISIMVSLGVEGSLLVWRIAIGIALVLVSTGCCLLVDMYIDKHLGILKGKFALLGK